MILEIYNAFLKIKIFHSLIITVILNILWGQVWYPPQKNSEIIINPEIYSELLQIITILLYNFRVLLYISFPHIY